MTHSLRRVLLRLLRTYLVPYRRPLIAVVLLQAIQALATLYLPKLNANIIDNGIAKGDVGYIWTQGGIMLAASVVQLAAAAGSIYFSAQAAMGFGRDVRSAVFDQVVSFSARELNLFGAPTLITRTTGDVQQVQQVAGAGFNMLLSAPVMIIGGVVMAVREDVGLSWLVVVSVAVMIIALGGIVTRLVPQYRAMQAKIDEVNRLLHEQLSGMRVIRAFVRENFERQRFEVANADLTASATRTGRLGALMFPTIMLVFNASSIAVLWFGAQRIDDGHMQVGSLVAFLSYLMQILLSVMMATFTITMIPRASVCADRIGEVLDTDSSVVPPANPVTTTTEHATVQFNNAGFSYPGASHPILQDISFTIRPGQTTAIIGSTGAGKTTLLSLIPRLFDATSGLVTVNGVAVSDLSEDVLTRVIGLVPQKPYLFSGTIASNLRHGDPDATDEELWQALRIAQAEDFISAMADGLDAVVAQGGSNLSGGQRQRIAIARALVRKPEIYLFDDSFSALDLATDARLRSALVPQTADAAVVIVAQRVSTIQRADQIIVLDDGAIVGIGTHDELLTTCNTYLEIVQSQITEEDAA